MRPEHQCIIESLESGKRFITASQRQTRFIQSIWQTYQLNKLKNSADPDQQQHCWEQANCISWDDWLLQSFELCNLQLSLQGDATTKLLSNLEQRWLWQGYLIKLNKERIQLENKPLTQQHSLLNSLLQSWNLFQNWRLHHLDAIKNEFNASEETRLFIKLISLFAEDCKKNQWISKQSLSDFIADHFELWSQQNKVDICYYGFDDWTPQQQYFHEKTALLESVNFNQLKTSLTTKKALEVLHPCASKYAEWQQAANWARQQAEKDNEANIAVVIPSLSNDRAQIIRIFQEAFQPQLQLEAEAKVPQGFNISVGEAIDQQAIIQSPRNWLNLLKGAKGGAWKSAIVDGFCHGANEERWSRATLANKLDLQNTTFYSVSRLQKLISKNDIISISKLSELLQIIKDYEEKANTKKSSGEWCLLLEQYLEDIGWPGDATIVSQAFQARLQWLEKFRQLSAMDEFCGKQSLTEFLKLLDEHMQTSKFQPETPAARVQVLGLLEAIGLSFDSIWLCGCQDSVFPAPLNASPWLPVHIQQSSLMPGASPQREQLFAETLFNGMQNSCDKMHYSYALTDADTELKPTTLINHLFDSATQADTVAEIVSESLPSYWHQQLQSGKASIKLWKDIQGEKLLTTKVKSGVAILKNQASCPFKAYAEFRLNAATKRQPTIGIDPMVRGNWVHDVLEMVWLRLSNQTALLKLDQKQQLELVRNCTNEIIFTPAKNTALEIDKNSPLIQLEFERTVALVMLWLEIDRNRSDDFTVVVEETQQTTIASLSFIVRADRIDEIANGRKLIIDYKTGKTTTSSWFSERITEPQLPLYGLIFSDNLTAIAIAELTPAATRLKGFSDESLEVTGIKPIEDWTELIQQWQINLETVAEEYAQGYAAVDPNIDSCNYCEYAHLCRRDSYFIDETVSQLKRGDA